MVALSWLAIHALAESEPTQRERELAALRALYERVASSRYPDAAAIERFVGAILDALDYELSEPMREALSAILANERFRTNAPDFEKLDLRQLVELRKELRTWELKSVDGQQLAEAFLLGVFYEIAEALPKARDPSPFTIPFIYAFPDARAWISSLYKTLLDDRYQQREMFEWLRTKLYLNICHASGIEPFSESSRAPVHAYKSDLPLGQLNDTYLGGTPFHALFASPVPLQLTHQDRFNHMHVLAGSGVGKTVLIETLIRHDLRSPEPPSIILIDPHSDLVRKLMRSDLGIEDRLILLDPRDTQYPVALNPFAINQERFSGYDEVTREQVTAGVIQTFGYLWNGLTNLTLTGKQEVFFRYVTRLLLTLPEVEGRNATILDMLRLMHDPAPYQAAIGRLPDIQREFFERDFKSKIFEATREQIRYRLQAIIENPTMARLFTAPETKVDFFTEMNRGAVILVDTAKDFLKDGSAVFGKLMISLILQAVLERAAIPEHERKPTFLMVDEAGSFFSSNIDDLLTEARKYKCGLLLAHQYLDQGTSSLRASLAANTGIKFASGLSAQDAYAMARDMRTSAEFILSQPRLQFAAHIRHVTPSAVSIPIEPVNDSGSLSDEAYQALIERNRSRVSLGRAPSARTAPPEAAPLPEDISPEW
ncbi:DUF87 domain-containing protein [Sphingomonas sp. AOB5]|uniref:type IV secretory system conjugative DNA transfer family protein n=1 Tax=Sphingomonas sp. AOB5 TaxID=3034017 RepID=UPI0023F94734|nr:DUF87 domain-containing protein [Sphingomonas sp. AOB5]MDF7774270.1 DUF87 domain-containing protein [Sphingomonas sp. AOB5]